MINKENANEKQNESLKIDIARMRMALSSKSYVLPKNLTREEVRDFICSVAKGEKE